MQTDSFLTIPKTTQGLRDAMESVLDEGKGLDKIREVLRDMEIIQRYNLELKRGRKAEEIKTELSLEYFNTCQLKKIEYILYKKY